MSLFIGSLELNDKIMVAPMAGVTDRPFRLMIRKFSKALLFTEMISANSITRAHKKTLKMSQTYEDEQPIAAQIVGGNPKVMAEAAKICEQNGASIIDINLGCPVKKLINNNSGAFLMQNPEKIGDIVAAVRNAVSIPVSVKIRSGWNADSINADVVAAIAESQGADMVVVHGRTREQFYSGKVNLDIIAKVKTKINIPVIGNGDIYSSKDAIEMIEKTNCSGVMIGRGILGRPWIVSQISNAIEHTCQDEEMSNNFKKSLVLEHYDKILNYYGIRNGIKIARKHIGWYSKSIKDSTDFRQRFNVVNDLDIAKNMINNFF